MQKIIRDAIAPIARIMPMARPAFAPAVMPPELEDVESCEELTELVADTALADVDDEVCMVRLADNIGRVLATEVEGERIDAGKPSEELAAAVVCGTSVEESTPRSVVTVVSWASGVEVAAAGWAEGALGVV
jgi:hypothetical protein